MPPSAAVFTSPVTPATRSSAFPSTRWTLIQRVRSGSPAEKAAALEELCRAYWFPLYAFARRSGLDIHEAEDAVQSFVLDLIQRGLFAQADQDRGNLRALLITACRRYLNNYHKHEQRARRGGHIRHIAFVPPDAEGRYQIEVASSQASPDEIFHRKWAENVINRSIERLQQHFDENGHSERFQVMRAYLPWNGNDEEDTAAGAAAAGMTAGAFRTALYRLRDRYRDFVYEEVRQTLGPDLDAEAIEEEIRELFKALATATPV